MNTYTLMALCIGSGAVVYGWCLLFSRPRFGFVAPWAAAAGTLLVHHAPALGAFADAGAPLSMGIDPAAQFVIILACFSIGCAMLLSPGASPGDIWAAAAVGAAATAALAARQPVPWAVSIAFCSGAVGLRWISGRPSRAALGAGRMLGVGTTCLLLSVALYPASGPGIGPLASLEGGLLAAATVSLLALAPLGAWAAVGCVQESPVNAVLWIAAVVPVTLLTVVRLQFHMKIGTLVPYFDVPLVLGLGTALFQGVGALRVSGNRRYVRVLLADIGLAAAGFGTSHWQGAVGGVILLAAQATVAPILLQVPGTIPARLVQLAEVSLSGIPPSLSFWGRFLILQSLALANVGALDAGIAVVAMLLLATLTPLVPIRSASASSQPGHRLSWRTSGAVLALIGAYSWGLLPQLLLVPLGHI